MSTTDDATPQPSVAGSQEGLGGVDDLPRKPGFKASRLTPSTFVIKEYADIYDEHPLIYTKICAEINVIVIIDTGCGGTTEDEDIDLKSLRSFIERVPIGDNAGRPLNQGGKMKYIVVLSHCHYDHILGVEEFSQDSQILASAHSPAFLDPTELPTHTLCKYLHIEVPTYKPTLIPHQHTIRLDQSTTHSPTTGLTVLHTPGHTPDELAVWDENERMLYVGDTLYEWAPIIFPAEGSIVQWLTSVDDLLNVIGEEEARVSCGHVTSGQPAQKVLATAKAFMVDVLRGKEKVKQRGEKRGEIFVQYIQEGHRFSLACPERLVKEAQNALRL